MLGTVYFIQEGDCGAIKIGWTTNDVNRRRDNLQIGNSADLRVIGTIPSVPISIEADWHMQFADARKRSEWFHPVQPLLSAIHASTKIEGDDLSHLVVSSVATFRKKHGLTQLDFAAKVGVQDSAVSKWERGKVSSRKALEVHEVTGIPLHQLRPDLYREVTA